jgi:hypothetical protein
VADHLDPAGGGLGQAGGLAAEYGAGRRPPRRDDQSCRAGVAAGGRAG